MILRVLLCALLVLAAWATVPDVTSAQSPQAGVRRIALVIANAEYRSDSLIDLPGAQRDAAVISAALQRAGFAPQDIVIERNLDLSGMRRALSVFGARLSALGQQGMGFVYYAGHGIADSDGEGARNYLIPTDAAIGSAFDYPNAAYSVSNFLDGLNRTRARTVIVVLDACRRTPLRGDRGMVAEAVPTNMLVAYSASPGQAASDDGVYARRLAEEIVRSDTDITQVFSQVQYRVSADSRGSQRPRFDTGLTEPVLLSTATFPGVPSAPAIAPPPTTPSAPVTVPSNALPTWLGGRWRTASGQGFNVFGSMCYRYLEIVPPQADVIRIALYNRPPRSNEWELGQIVTSTGSGVTIRRTDMTAWDGPLIASLAFDGSVLTLIMSQSSDPCTYVRDEVSQ